MRRSVLVVLFRLGGTVVFVVGLGSLGGSGWEIMVKDRFVVVLPSEEVRSCSFCSRLERVVFVILGSGLLILIGRTTPMAATVADACLTTEIMGPALHKLGTWDVGLEDLVGGSIV